MSEQTSLALGFGIYLVIMMVVGIISLRYMKSLDDFVLGGRRLGPWVAAISERASGESAWFLLGLPGAAYALGFREFWSVIGIGFGIFASWAFLAYGLRKITGARNSLTLPDFLSLPRMDFILESSLVTLSFAAAGCTDFSGVLTSLPLRS